MKILYATSEAVPFCKTGGLADVAGSLPPALAAEGAEIAGIIFFTGDRCKNSTETGFSHHKYARRAG